jgi:hypothetical protein
LRFASAAAISSVSVGAMVLHIMKIGVGSETGVRPPFPLTKSILGNGGLTPVLHPTRAEILAASSDPK